MLDISAESLSEDSLTSGPGRMGPAGSLPKRYEKMRRESSAHGEKRRGLDTPCFLMGEGA